MAVCLNASIPVSIIRMLITTGANLNKAVGVERHFMIPLDAAELYIVPNDKASDGPDETLEIDGQNSDNKEAPTQKSTREAQSGDDEQSQHSGSAITQNNKHLELLDVFHRAGDRYLDENMNADRRAAWRRAMQRKLETTKR